MLKMLKTRHSMKRRRHRHKDIRMLNNNATMQQQRDDGWFQNTERSSSFYHLIGGETRLIVIKGNDLVFRKALDAWM
jgi:hypothetical protein